jgi:tRNA uridine 5-carboxymethylaminomethyl modification enzyme
VTELIGESEVVLSEDEKRRVEILVKYQAYIERSKKELESRKLYEDLSLKTVNYTQVQSLSFEGREMLERFQPDTLGAAQRLRGVRESDITALLVYVKRQGNVSRETISR